jgi:hypothetical protein
VRATTRAISHSPNAVHFRSSDLTRWLISRLRSPGTVAVIAQNEQYWALSTPIEIAHFC